MVCPSAIAKAFGLDAATHDDTGRVLVACHTFALQFCGKRVVWCYANR